MNAIKKTNGFAYYILNGIIVILSTYGLYQAFRTPIEYREHQLLFDRGVRASAVIANVKTWRDFGTGYSKVKENFELTVRFSTPDGLAHNIQIQNKPDHSWQDEPTIYHAWLEGDETAFDVGKTIEIIYDPAKPERAYPVDFMNFRQYQYSAVGSAWSVILVILVYIANKKYFKHSKTNTSM